MDDDPFRSVVAYHRDHGDDYGSEASRQAKYKAVMHAVARCPQADTLLDVGCGAREFQRFVPHLDYTGVDLLDGVNVLDVTDRYDLVVANGIFYKLPADTAQLAATLLLTHMWKLARQALVFTSLSTWAPARPGEYRISPLVIVSFCRRTMSTRLVLDHSYLPHDFTVAVYR